MSKEDEELAKLLKPPSKDPVDVIQRALKPLKPEWKFGKDKTISPYVSIVNHGRGPGVEVGFKITF